MSPRSEVLRLPQAYGAPAAVLDWAVVRVSLERAKAYWLATCRADGRPHVVPVDGLWLDDIWYYGGAPDAVHVRTAMRNPDVVMHLPDPQRSVIVEGRVRPARPGTGLARRLLEASNEKYPEYGRAADPAAYNDVLALRPTRVLAWTAYPRDATRFLFGE